MKYTLLILILVGFSSQQCAAGCLKCLATNTCSICDPFNNYYLNNGSCAVSNLTNCKITSQINTCIQCNAGFYVDASTSKCIAVPTASVVNNCGAYSPTFACTACSGNFVILSGLCAIVNTTVTNCATYSANGVCSVCSNGFILSYNLLTCVSLPTTSNCLFYTYGNCRSCNAGFFMNPNLYVLNLVPTPANVQNYFYNFNSAYIQQNVCQAITVTNCLTVSSFNTCTSCASGFFLSAGACVAFPLPVIWMCVTYSNLVTCSACSQGFFLSNNLCVAITAIPFCQTYSTTASSSVCIQCNTTSFVSGNACTNRTNSISISNCATYSLVSDVCLTCNTNFILTNNGVNCTAVVANCLTYSSLNPGTGNLICASCGPGFYLNTAGASPVCTSGTITNCATYSSSTVCSACNNGFYLVSGTTCTQHIAINNCLTYHASALNSCSVCNTGFFLFTPYQTCITGIAIANCATYSPDALTCTSCLPTYYLTGNTCTIIPTAATNCIAYSASASACSGCSSGFILATISAVVSCLTPLNYVSANCDVANTWLTSTSWSESTQFCNVCKQNTFPITPINIESICVLTTDLTAAYPGFTTGVSNCVRYGLNGANNIICMQCAATFLISGYSNLLGSPGSTSTAGTFTNPVCVASTACPTAAGSNTILIDDFFGSVNICLQGSISNPINVPNCQVAGRYMQQFSTQADLMCIQAVPAFTFVFSYSAANGYNYDAIPSPTTSITSVNGASSSLDFDHGYASVDVGSLIPKVFNYRGLLLTATANSAILPTLTANCDIAFLYPSISSAYLSGGALTGLYNVAATNTNACLRCSFGFQPSFTITGANGNSALPSCITMSTCSSNTAVYGGLPSFLNAALSCHSCSAVSNSPTFPTLAIEYDASATTSRGIFLSYYLRSASHLGFTCGSAPAGVVTSAATSTSVVANCAVYGIFAAQQGASANPSIINNLCLACATGFYPFYFANPNTAAVITGSRIPAYAVIQCTASANCATSPANTPFNSCGACSTASASLTPAVFFGYTDYRLINCLSVSTPNCFILKNTVALSATVVNSCGVCMAGYFLNGDGYCDLLTLPNVGGTPAFVSAYYSRSSAATPTNAKTGRWDNDLVRVHYLLSFTGLQYGVSSCASTYTLAPTHVFARTFCAISAYLTNAIVRPTPTVFYANCLKFTASWTAPSTYTCSACANNFLPIVGGVGCAATVLNCQIVRASPNSLQCHSCNSGYVNVNGVCNNQVITNCLTLANTAIYGTAALACSICSNGYTLATNGTCITGLVQNCNTYTNPSQTACTACATGFVLIVLSSGVNYCYPFPTATYNCVPVTTGSSPGTGIQQGTINCASCIYSSPASPLKIALWSAQTTTTLAQNTCLPFNSVLNCLTYSQASTTLNQNTFACTSCATGFFLLAANSLCIKRIVQDANCALYSVSLDQCTTCATGYFLTVGGLSCVAFPTGIAYCITYSSATTCTLCMAPYFLTNNACSLSTIVANCGIYTANFTCSACAASYYLASATSCVAASAQNCLTFSSATACATCVFGWQITTSNGISSCTQIQITSCAILNPSAQTTCLYCQTGFFLNSAGVCTAITTNVVNCLYYASATTCNNCTAGFALSVDGTICSASYTNVTDPNCANAVLSGTPVCHSCMIGYTWVNGACTACSLFSSGCLVCDQTNSTNCLLCKPGYYQIASSACVVIPIAIPTNVTPVATSCKIMKAVMSCLVIMFISFNRIKE